MAALVVTRSDTLIWTATACRAQLFRYVRLPMTHWARLARRAAGRQSSDSGANVVLGEIHCGSFARG